MQCTHDEIRPYSAQTYANIDINELYCFSPRFQTMHFKLIANGPNSHKHFEIERCKGESHKADGSTTGGQINVHTHIHKHPLFCWGKTERSNSTFSRISTS